MAEKATVTNTIQHLVDLVADAEMVKSFQEGDKRVEFHSPKDLVVAAQKLVQLDQDMEEKCSSRSTPLVGDGSGCCRPLI